MLVYHVLSKRTTLSIAHFVLISFDSVLMLKRYLLRYKIVTNRCSPTHFAVLTVLISVIGVSRQEVNRQETYSFTPSCW